MAEEAAKVYEEEIDNEKMMAFCKQTHSFKDGFIRVQPYKCIFPRGYINHEDKIKNTEILEDDIWITSHPKSGTRWIQELVWLLRNNLDYDKASTTPLNMREPFHEMTIIDPLNNFGANECFTWIEKCPTPRIVKTHLSFDMLPKQLIDGKAKLVVLMRNPRDVCCSLLNHYRITDNYTGSMDALTDAFLEDVAPYYGPYFVHVLSYWKQRENRKNMHILWYEELQSDFAGTTKKLAEFLDASVSDADIPKLKDYLSFDNMKKNPMVNMDQKMKMVKEKLNSENEGSMINKGKTGRWKEVFDEQTIKHFEEWEAKWLKDTDFKIVF